MPASKGQLVRHRRHKLAQSKGIARRSYTANRWWARWHRRNERIDEFNYDLEIQHRVGKFRRPRLALVIAAIIVLPPAVLTALYLLS